MKGALVKRQSGPGLARKAAAETQRAEGRSQRTNGALRRPFCETPALLSDILQPLARNTSASGQERFAEENAARWTAQREQEPWGGGGMESGAQQRRVRASSRRAAGGAGRAAEPSQDGDALTAKKTTNPKPRVHDVDECGVSHHSRAPAAPRPPARQRERRRDRVRVAPALTRLRGLGCPPGQQPAWLGGALSGRRKAQQTLSRGLPRSPREGGTWTRTETEGDVLAGGERDRRPECCLEEKVP